jgi:regulator of nonsense transcripts 3
MPPKVLAKHHDRAGGVLPVSGAARAAPTKSTSTARLKLEIRRLPPGLTLGEFEEILGPVWKLGNRKVDWREYRQGKFKQAIGKVPEQSRCYIHLTSEALVKDFEARFLQVVFHDKAGTHKSPDLRHLPPTLGFAPNQRMALNVKARTDTRQGTIDQDPEFIRFLEAETQPISKPAALDTVGAEKEKVERVGATSTPLIEAIREKKANKAKAAAAKEEKRDGKSHAKTENKEVPVVEKPNKEARSAAAQKTETAAKEPAKAVNKHVASKQQQQQQRPASPQQSASTKGQPSPAKSKRSATNAKGQSAAATQPAASSAAPTASATATAQTSSSTTPAAPRQRQKGNPEGLKKLFQKDLGIKPKPAAAAKETTPAAPKPKTETPTVSAATKAKEPAQLPSSKAQPNSKASAAAKSENQSAASASSSSHKAYLKHANPSQGMTEVLIQQALSQFGDVVSVTIDPRKGTAIALFKDAQGLQKAREAKRVTVASGNVEVHEFKDRSAGSGGGSGNRGGHRPNRNTGRGGGGGAGKGSAAATTATSTAAAGDAPKTNA